MRLTSHERDTIKAASLRHFGVPVRLFGSRVDDARRGGDIDLYIEAPLTPAQAFSSELAMAVELWKALGERKIDIVVSDGQQLQPIHLCARRDGVWL